MPGRKIGEDDHPLVCTPLVGKTRETVLSELEAVLSKKPDVIEWRADHFEAIGDFEAVIELAGTMKKMAADIPLIFTVRSVREGGQPTPLSVKEVVELNARICRDTDIEYIDYELSNRRENIDYLLAVARSSHTGVIGSYHNFKWTPGRDALNAKIKKAEQCGFDVVKIAVMAESVKDVLQLLSLTLEAKGRVKIPVISISMGRYGVIGRMIGWCFGSALTFAVGQNPSAPGQVPLEDLRTVIDIVHRAMS